MILIFDRRKDRKERKTEVYNNTNKISFQYLPLSTQPNQLKIVDFFCKYVIYDSSPHPKFSSANLSIKLPDWLRLGEEKFYFYISFVNESV